MPTDTIAALPDDPEVLKRIIIRLEKEQNLLLEEIDLLREQIRMLHAKLFGKKSEKTGGRSNKSETAAL